MLVAKQTHVLVSTGPLTDLDAPASALALMSRGRRVLVGALPERVELAGLLDGLLLARVLADGRPLVVDTVPQGYVFEEV